MKAPERVKAALLNEIYMDSQQIVCNYMSLLQLFAITCNYMQYYVNFFFATINNYASTIAIICPYFVKHCFEHVVPFAQAISQICETLSYKLYPSRKEHVEGLSFLLFYLCAP